MLLTACGGDGGTAPQPTAASAQATADPAKPAATTAAQPAAATTKPAATAAAKPGASGGTAGAELEKVAMPSGGAKYDPSKAVKIGDVLELPASGLVMQVTGAKTVDYDGQQDLLLVELILGNRNKEKYTVSSVLFMSAVTADWRWYSLGMDELFKAAAKIGSLNIKTFDTDLPPGEARKGTAVLPVPKNAEKLAFAFSPMNPTNPLADADPTVYVSLGIRGEFQPPVIPDSAQVAKAGSSYKVGEAVKLTKRGVGIQVNSVSEVTDSVPDNKINVGEKFVVVDLTMRGFGDAKPLSGQEISLLDGAGKSYTGGMSDSSSVARAIKGHAYSAADRRGLMVFKTERDSKGFALKVRPIDPTSQPMKPSYIEDESISFGLGSGAAVAVPTPMPNSGGTGMPSIPGLPGGITIPGMPPGVGQGGSSSGGNTPKVTDSSALPAELKPLPVPSGFQVIADSAERWADGGKFQSAEAEWFGKLSIKEVADFYTRSLTAEWDVVDEYVAQGECQLTYSNKKDEMRSLYVNAEQTNEGTTLYIRLEQYED